MPGHEPHDPISGSIEAHPVKLAIGIVIGTVALIIGIILMTQLAVSMYGNRPLKGDPTMSDKAIAQRIAPVAQVAIDPNAPAQPAAPAAAPAAAPTTAVAIPPPAAKTAAAGGEGKSTYDSACFACHATGVAGAPKLGDKAAWAPRLKEGRAHLHEAALKGKGAMPPKGGNTALSDAAVKAAVDYMMAAVK